MIERREKREVGDNGRHAVEREKYPRKKEQRRHEERVKVTEGVDPRDHCREHDGKLREDQAAEEDKRDGEQDERRIHQSEQSDHDRDRDAENDALGGAPDQLACDEVVEVYRRGKDRIKGLLEGHADIRAVGAFVHGREHGRRCDDAGRDELDVGLAVDLLHKSAESEPHGNEVQRRLCEIERKARFVEFGIYGPVPLPDPDHALNPQGSSRSV